MMSCTISVNKTSLFLKNEHVVLAYEAHNETENPQTRTELKFYLHQFQILQQEPHAHSQVFPVYIIIHGETKYIGL